VLGNVSLHCDLPIVSVAITGTDPDAEVTGPFGLDCKFDGSGQCIVAVSANTPVTLTALNADGYTVDWPAACSSTTATTCTIDNPTAYTPIAVDFH
jgi:hypothetical protein